MGAGAMTEHRQQKQMQQAAKRLTDFGRKWDARNGFGVPPVVQAPIAPPKKRNLKTGITAAIREGAASVLRRQVVVVPVRCVAANGDFGKWLERRAA